MIDLGLERVTALLKALNDPHHHYDVVHVAGTNGKGSVCAMMSAVLAAGRIRCGLFTSPALVGPWDCIRIDDEAMTEAAYREVDERVRSLNTSIKATEFEILTVVALLHFKESGIKIAVVEVGMGGRLDATNVFPKPLICLFTPISYDHVEFLGNTIELIAKEKAGILKPGAHAVVGKQIYEEANNVFKTEAARVGAPLEFSQIVDEVEVADTREGMTVKLTFKGESHVVTSHLEGDFQRVNIGIVCRAFEVLDRIKPAEYPCTASMVEAGLKGVNWPGRMQKLAIADSNVSFILDGAHNDHGINCLSSYVDANLRKNGKTLTWVTGFKAGKDCKPLLEKLLRRGDKLIAVGFSQPEGMPWISCLPPLQVRESAVSLFSDIDATHFDTIDQALSYLREKKVSGTIFVCGSLYLVRDTLRSTLASTKRTLPN